MRVATSYGSTKTATSAALRAERRTERRSFLGFRTAVEFGAVQFCSVGRTALSPCRRLEFHVPNLALVMRRLFLSSTKVAQPKAARVSPSHYHPSRNTRTPKHDHRREKDGPEVHQPPDADQRHGRADRVPQKRAIHPSKRRPGPGCGLAFTGRSGPR